MPTRQLLAAPGIDENIQFLVLEVRQQLEDTLRLMADPRGVSEEKIFSRDDYIDNLKSTIENKAYAVLGPGTPDRAAINRIRAINTITTNLERIGDFTTNIVGQMHYLRDQRFMERYPYRSFFEEILKAVDQIVDALFRTDIPAAMKICRTELRLDAMYKTQFERIMADLRTGRDTENLVTALFIIRYFERIGDSLLNIGEAIISAAVGEKLKIHQYQALEESIESAELGSDLSDFTFDGIWETRSGCRIGRIRDTHHGSAASWVIFKDGRQDKLVKEKQNIERLDRLIPGLTPRIIDYHVHGENATILLENLPGKTYQMQLLESDPITIRHSRELVQRTFERIWSETKSPQPTNAHYLGQLRHRMDDVYKVHPDFRYRESKIGNIGTPAFDQLLDSGAALDTSLSAPFTTLIHGDANVDNVMVDGDAGRIFLIDLHRSADSDYVQDVSVFLVSHFRLPVFDSLRRGFINDAAIAFYRFASEFATRQGDETFDARLSLGLIRSFVTSTRFVLNQRFADAMYMRSVFLLEKLLAADSQTISRFRLPEDVLVY